MTIRDDHSRYLLGAKACADECDSTVRQRLEQVFEMYGLPDAMITDNGNPPILKLGGQQNGPTKLTRLSVWLIRLGIKPLWSRPRHPQTMGKLERLHRTLKAELLQGGRFWILEPPKPASTLGAVTTITTAHTRPWTGKSRAVPT